MIYTEKENKQKIINALTYCSQLGCPFGIAKTSEDCMKYKICNECIKENVKVIEIDN